MAAAVQQPPQPNGTVAPSIKIVGRLDSLPVVHDSVAYADYLIHSTQFTTNLYLAALGLAQRSVEVASPVISRAKPLIESADGLAVATLDKVEAKFPAIKTPTQDIAAVKQAKAIYDARVAPLVSQATPVINEVVAKTTAINTQLGASAHYAIQQSTEISHALVEQLHALSQQGKELPHQLYEGLSKVTNDVKSIVLAKDGTVQEKTNKLGAYVVEQVKPIVDEIYRHVVGATKAAEERATSVKTAVLDQANQTAAKVTKVADKAQAKASAKVSAATTAATDKVAARAEKAKASAPAAPVATN